MDGSQENKGKARSTRRLFLSRSIALLMPAFLAGCNFAPDYAPPPVEVPVKYKEAGTWDEARPRDDVSRGPWWRALNDRKLDELESQIDGVIHSRTKKARDDPT